MYASDSLKSGLSILGCAVLLVALSACELVHKPSVIATDPAAGETGVPLNTEVSATFNTWMYPETINSSTFTLMRGNTPVSGEVSYSKQTAVFTPTNALLPNTVYTARITTEAEALFWWRHSHHDSNDKNLHPVVGYLILAHLIHGGSDTGQGHGHHRPHRRGLASDHVWSFTTTASPGVTAPSVTSTVPANGDTSAPLGRNLSATFTKAMNPATINASTFTLSQGSVSIPGVVSYVGVTAVFNPSVDLAPNTPYTARVTTGAQDLDGNALAADFVWNFTTGSAADTTAPTVTSTDPANGATGVGPNKRITAAFSEAMNPSTINANTFTVHLGSTPIAGTVSYAGVTATFTPSATLAPNSTYTASILPPAADLAGNELAGEFVWTFSTGTSTDTTAPFVSFTDPAVGATGVGINKKVSATFSKTMNAGTINTSTFSLRQGSTPIVGTVTYSGVTAVFSPLAPLASNTTYTATVRMEATDLAGNPMEADQAWSFTTGATVDAIPPMVESTDPVDGAIGVPINKAISATFSKGMDPLTINTSTVTVSQNGTPVSGTVTYEDVTATFMASGNLTADTTYTVMVLMEATDLAGNPMTSDVMWEFTTGATTAQQTIELGSANAFAILAGSTVSSTGPSVVNGDLGVSPGTAVTGFPPGVVNGDTFTGVASAAGQAKEDLTAAFNEAAGRSTGSVSLPGDLSGLTLYPGLYTNSTSVMLSAGAVTLDAQGDPNAVFLFKMGSTLTTSPGTQVILAGGANAANIYWQVGTSATLGTTSTFQGNILAQESITLATGATLDGRALTQTAAVSLDAATITTPAP